MKKHVIQALFIGSFGMLLFILTLTLELQLIHPLALGVLILFVVALSEALITFRSLAGWPAQVVMDRVLQTTMLSTFITSLPMLASAGYLWLLRTQQPGQISIQTAHTNYYRDAPEVALDVFAFLTLVGLGLSVILGCVARYLASRDSFQHYRVKQLDGFGG